MPIKKLKTSLSPLRARNPPQIPPESAADLPSEKMSRDSSSWQTVQPRQSARGNCQSSRASRAMSGKAARVVLPAVMRDVMRDVMTSSVTVYRILYPVYLHRYTVYRIRSRYF